MTKKIIRLCYRKVIDAGSQQLWDKYVFESTYKEFLLQSQLYNQEKKYSTFSDLLLQVKGAQQLHFLVSAAAICYLQQLGDKIPDIVNTLGKQFLSLKNYQFEILQSDIKNKAAHKIAISFFSEPLIWHDTIHDMLLVSDADGTAGSDGIVTNMIQLKSSLGINSLKTEPV